MTSKEVLQSLDAVAAHLPFAVTDMAAANDLYARWKRTSSGGDERLVDIWTYCFVRRYYLLKFMYNEGHEAPDFEALVEKVYRKIHEKRTGVRDPGRYAHWVHVVCRNTYRNYLRSRAGRTVLELDSTLENTVLVEEPATATYDAVTLYGVVVRTIEQLPRHLREVATRRLIREESYQTIAEAVGRPVPTVRSYMHKAILRLRNNPTLQEYLEELMNND